jgi:hypothetical protein
MKNPLIFDAFFAVGVVLLFAVLWLVYPPFAVVMVGAILLALGVTLARAYANSSRDPKTKMAQNPTAQHAGARLMKDAAGREVLVSDITTDRGAIVPEDE